MTHAAPAKFSIATPIYRLATQTDIFAMVRIRAAKWAVDGDGVIGLVAGHLTPRFGRDGELEWIDVVRERRSGIASEVLRILALWFVEQKARRVCVDPGNEIAFGFYALHGAEALNRQWMISESWRP